MCLYRTHRKPEHGGDLFVLPPLQMEERYDGSVLFRQGVDGRPQARSLVECDRLALRTGRRVGAFGELLTGKVPPAIEPIAARMVRDGEDPRREFCIRLEGSQAAKRFEKSLLRYVARLFGIVQRPVR